MKLIIFINYCLIFLFNEILNVTPASLNDVDVGYYWRDYTRDIPKDAIPGGVDKRGKTTYIGQTLHKGCLTGIIVTGQIDEAGKKMTYEWGTEKHEAKNPVQILCTNHKERYGWIKTNSKDIVNLVDKHLVSGGKEENFNVYVGRVTADDEIAIGRILVTNVTDMNGLYAIVNGQFLHVFNSFEVLSYDDSIPPERRIRADKLTRSGASAISCVLQPILIVSILQMLFHTIK